MVLGMFSEAFHNISMHNYRLLKPKPRYKKTQAALG